MIVLKICFLKERGDNVSVIHLIKIEFFKIYKKKFFVWIVLSIMTVCIGNLLLIKTFESSPTDWKKNLANEIVQQKKELNSAESNEIVDSIQKKEISIKEYQIKKDIKPLYKDTSMGFVKSSLSTISIITFFIIIISASIVSQEYSDRTINLLLMKPVKRWKILLSKFISIQLSAMILILVLLIVSTVLGYDIFDSSDQSYKYVYINKDNSIISVNIFVHFFEYILSKIVSIIMISSFAFMISTILRNSSLAIALSILIQYSASLLANIMVVFFDNSIIKYIFFLHTNIYQHVEGKPPFNSSLQFSISILIVYFIIFASISVVFFNKRDVLV